MSSSNRNPLLQMSRDIRHLIYGYQFTVAEADLPSESSQQSHDVIAEINALYVQKSEIELGTEKPSEDEVLVEMIAFVFPFIKRIEDALACVKKIATTQLVDLKLDSTKTIWDQLQQGLQQISLEKWLAANSAALSLHPFKQTNIVSQFRNSPYPIVKDAAAVAFLLVISSEEVQYQFSMQCIDLKNYEYLKLMIENGVKGVLGVAGSHQGSVNWMFNHLPRSVLLDIFASFASSQYYMGILNGYAYKKKLLNTVLNYLFLFQESLKKQIEEKETKTAIASEKDKTKCLDIAKAMSSKVPLMWDGEYNCLKIAIATLDQETIEVIAGFSHKSQACLNMLYAWAVDLLDIDLYKKTVLGFYKSSLVDVCIDADSFVKLMVSSDRRSLEFLRIIRNSIFLPEFLYLRDIIDQKITTGQFSIDKDKFAAVIMNTHANDAQVIEMMLKLDDASSLLNVAFVPSLASELLRRTATFENKKIENLALEYRKRHLTSQLPIEDTRESKFNLQAVYKAHGVTSFRELASKIPKIAAEDPAAMLCMIYNAQGNPEFEKILVRRLMVQDDIKRTLFHYMAKMDEYSDYDVTTVMSLIPHYINRIADLAFVEHEESDRSSSMLEILQFMKDIRSIRETSIADEKEIKFIKDHGVDDKKAIQFMQTVRAPDDKKISDRFVERCLRLEDSKGNTVVHLLALHPTDKFKAFSQAGEFSFDVNRSPTPIDLLYNSGFKKPEEWVEFLISINKSLSTMKYFLKYYNPPFYRDLERDTKLTPDEYRAKFMAWYHQFGEGDLKFQFLKLDYLISRQQDAKAQLEALQSAYSFENQIFASFAIRRINVLKAYESLKEMKREIKPENLARAFQSIERGFAAFGQISMIDREFIMRIAFLSPLRYSFEGHVAAIGYYSQLKKSVPAFNANPLLETNADVFSTAARTRLRKYFGKRVEFSVTLKIKRDEQIIPIPVNEESHLMSKQLSIAEATEMLDAIHVDALPIIFQIISKSNEVFDFLMDLINYRQIHLLAVYIQQENLSLSYAESTSAFTQTRLERVNKFFNVILQYPDQSCIDAIFNRKDKYFIKMLDVYNRQYSNDQNNRIVERLVNYLCKFKRTDHLAKLSDINLPLDSIVKSLKTAVDNNDLQLFTKMMANVYVHRHVLWNSKENFCKLLSKLLLSGSKYKAFLNSIGDHFPAIIVYPYISKYIFKITLDKKVETTSAEYYDILSSLVKQYGQTKDRHQYVNMLDMMLELNEKGFFGKPMNPIHLAAQHVDLDMLKALCNDDKRQLDFNVNDRLNPTPIQLAYESKQPKEKIIDAVYYIVEHSKTGKECLFDQFGPTVSPREREQKAAEWIRSLPYDEKAGPVAKPLVALDYCASKVNDSQLQYAALLQLFHIMRMYTGNDAVMESIYVKTLLRINCYAAMSAPIFDDKRDHVVKLNQLLKDAKRYRSDCSPDAQTQFIRARLLSGRDSWLSKYVALNCLNIFTMTDPKLAVAEMIRLDTGFTSYQKESDQNKLLYALNFINSISRALRVEKNQDVALNAETKARWDVIFNKIDSGIKVVTSAPQSDGKKLLALMKFLADLSPPQHPLKVALENTRTFAGIKPSAPGATVIAAP